MVLNYINQNAELKEKVDAKITIFQTDDIFFSDNEVNFITPDPLNVIVNVYTNEVSVDSLNNLYIEIFDNIQTLLFNFNAVINSYNIRHIYLVNISNFLNMVILILY